MEAAALRQALRTVRFPEGLGWAVREATGDPDALFPEERAAVSKAIPARIAEFAGGRSAARAAMAQLGLPPRAIPARPDRAPHWPEGVLGSISHAGPVCLAVVGRSADWEMIGIDLEPDRAMAAELVSEVASPDELAALAPLPATLAAARIFSAKEAAYKAQYPLTGALFGFDAMQANLQIGRMNVAKNVGLGSGASLPMWQLLVANHVVSLCLSAKIG
jgi:4'-phosphopantetheinyl transferase EntD